MAIRIFYYIAPFDLRGIAVNLAKAAQLIGLVLAVPGLVALVGGEYPFFYIFGGIAIITLTAGRLIVKAFPDMPDLELREALVVTALSYLIFAVLGALAFLPVAPWTDSLFETMSGITTTGLTLMQIDMLPKSLLFFRAYSQWLGGLGIVVLSLAVLIQPGKSAHQLYLSSFSNATISGSVAATARVVAVIYLTLTLAGLAAFILAGMEPFDALLHIMTTVSTGGFSNHRQSIGHYRDQPAIQAVVMLFMLLGAINLTLYYHARHHGFKKLIKNIEVLFLFGLATVGAVIFRQFEGSSAESILAPMFRAITSITTTGFSVTDPAGWQDKEKILSSCLMVIGGSTCSTAGGIKIFRLIFMLKLVEWYFKKMLLPKETKMAVKFEQKAIMQDEINQLFGFLVLYIAILGMSSLAFAAAGFSFADAVFESASALGTVGLSSGVTSPELPGSLKFLLIFDMWAGRLEIMPVIMTFYPAIRLGRRRKS